MTDVADKAVEFAMAQRGKAYIYGAAGPNAYDCSGLVMAAYLHASSGEIALPHNAQQQRNMVHVFAQIGHLYHDLKYLKPGDLIFYYGTAFRDYRDPSHVGMYVDHDNEGHRIVQATNEERGIEVVRVYELAQPTSFGRVVRAQKEL